MKTNKKIVRKSTLEKRREMKNAVLPAVRKLVAQYDLPSVQAAVKVLYENRKAEKELRDAEAKVEALKKKLA